MNNGIRHQFIHKYSPIRAVCTVALLSILLLGCNFRGPESDHEIPFPNFAQVVDAEEFPEGFVISPSDSDIVVGINDPVDLLITNKSDHTIAFSQGYGTRLFGYDRIDEQWVEINNRVNYIGEGDTLGSKSQGSNNWAAIVKVAPEITEHHSYEIMRVVVIGTVVDSTGVATSKVAAYIDLPIE